MVYTNKVYTPLLVRVSPEDSDTVQLSDLSAGTIHEMCLDDYKVLRATISAEGTQARSIPANNEAHYVAVSDQLWRDLWVPEYGPIASSFNALYCSATRVYGQTHLLVITEGGDMLTIPNEVLDHFVWHTEGIPDNWASMDYCGAFMRKEHLERYLEAYGTD